MANHPGAVPRGTKRTYCQRIWRAVAAIPPGQVATYGGIAERVGLPRRARLVGHALRQLPAGSSVPWHRVIRAGGRIAFPPGSDSHREQCRRLAAEGVLVLNGRVDMDRYDWQPSLDELLWKPRD